MTLDTPKVILYAKPKREQDDFEWIPTKAMDNPLSCAPEYLIEQKEPLRIEREMKLFKFEEKYKNGGKMSIVSLSDIIVGTDGVIDASCCGLK